jgi:hypothetical protein
MRRKASALISAIRSTLAAFRAMDVIPGQSAGVESSFAVAAKQRSAEVVTEAWFTANVALGFVL